MEEKYYKYAVVLSDDTHRDYIVLYNGIDNTARVQGVPKSLFSCDSIE